MTNEIVIAIADQFMANLENNPEAAEAVAAKAIAEAAAGDVEVEANLRTQVGNEIAARLERDMREDSDAAMAEVVAEEEVDA